MRFHVVGIGPRAPCYRGHALAQGLGCEALVRGKVESRLGLEPFAVLGNERFLTLCRLEQTPPSAAQGIL